VDFMARALELADRALGRVSPNPAVGAVLVRDGLIVGEGFTQPPGQAHAEIVALTAAGPRARGAEMYVTLEPCCHVGRTPPCTEAIIAAGVAAVHVAVPDPYPQVNGQGINALQRAGITVTVGAHRGEAERLNAAFFHFVRTGRPLVTAKWAMSADGKVATRLRDSRWVTSPAARRAVHRERDASDAIIVGIGTVLADDPALTVRLEEEGEAQRAPRPCPPLRVVLDSQARMPPTARMLRDGGGPVLVYVTAHAPADRVRALVEAGAEVIPTRSVEGRPDPSAVLADLARRGAIRVLLEAGPTLMGAFLDHQLIDRVMAFIAPRLVGGASALSPVGGEGIARMRAALPLVDVSVCQTGPDVLMEGRLSWEPAAGGSSPEE